jgi:hypothetical protein
MSNWFEPPPEHLVPAPSPSAQRVSDAERDHTVTMLREHVVAGRLTLDEFSERVGWRSRPGAAPAAGSWPS